MRLKCVFIIAVLHLKHELWECYYFSMSLSIHLFIWVIPDVFALQKGLFCIGTFPNKPVIIGIVGTSLQAPPINNDINLFLPCLPFFYTLLFSHLGQLTTTVPLQRCVMWINRTKQVTHPSCWLHLPLWKLQRTWEWWSSFLQKETSMPRPARSVRFSGNGCDVLLIHFLICCHMRLRVVRFLKILLYYKQIFSPISDVWMSEMVWIEKVNRKEALGNYGISMYYLFMLKLYMFMLTLAYNCL